MDLVISSRMITSSFIYLFENFIISCIFIAERNSIVQTGETAQQLRTCITFSEDLNSVPRIHPGSFIFTCKSSSRKSDASGLYRYLNMPIYIINSSLHFHSLLHMWVLYLNSQICVLKLEYLQKVGSLKAPINLYFSQWNYL